MSEQRQAASYRLVPMTMEWIPQIAELERQCFSKPWNEQMLAEELDNPTASFIVAVGDNGQVLGYAGISVIAGEGYIDNVAVRRSTGGRASPRRCWMCFCASARHISLPF